MCDMKRQARKLRGLIRALKSPELKAEMDMHKQPSTPTIYLLGDASDWMPPRYDPAQEKRKA